MKEETKKKLAWIVGAFCIFFFAETCTQHIIPAILSLIIGILMLPPVNELAKDKIDDKEKMIKFHKYKNDIIVIATILFVASMIVLGEKDQQEKNKPSSLVANTTNATNTVYLNTVDYSIDNVNQNIVDKSTENAITETNGEYIGERVNGKKQGIGKFIWKNGNVYEGNFEQDKISGKGKLTFTNTEIYEGNFVDGKREGEGKFCFLNGDIYVGQWQSDKMSGKGEYTFANGDKYEGEFLDNKFNGTGTYIKGEKKYTGTWKDNQYNTK